MERTTTTTIKGAKSKINCFCFVLFFQFYFPYFCIVELIEVVMVIWISGKSHNFIFIEFGRCIFIVGATVKRTRHECAVAAVGIEIFFIFYFFVGM